MRALPAIIVIALSAQPVLGQAPDLRRAGLPREEARRLEALIEHEDTRRYRGDVTIEAGTVLDGPVYLERGILTVAGTILGELIVVDGDVVFVSGSSVSGDVIVVGGTTVDAENARLAGTLTEYGEGFGLLAQAERIHDGRDDWRGDRRGDWRGEEYSRQHAELAVRVDANYNRVEGLPIAFGPDIRTGGSSPTRIEALAVWRTDVGPITNTQRMGYIGRVEQFLGSDFRLGGSVRSTVDPIEPTALSDLEASLAAAMLHEDQRDYYEREGWSAYMRIRPRRSPLDLIVEYRDERHATVAPRDPWTLFNRDDPWRLQPLVGEGRIRLIDGRVTWDTRRGGDWVQSGAYVGLNLIQGVDGSLDMPVTVSPSGPVMTWEADRLTAGTLDIRRYAPVGWFGSLGLRIMAGGSLNGDALPPQFQHALGGAGTMPGYPLLSMDCGARSLSASDGVDRFFSSYGCDRFALAQVEYRGGFDFHIGHDHDGRGIDFDAGIDWTVFFDVARGWALGDDASRADTETLYDAGAGIVLGGFGIYGAVPLTGDDREIRVFIRLGPRF